MLAGACLTGSVWLVVFEVRPPPPPTVTVVTAALPVEAGTVLTGGDLTTTPVPAGAQQPGALTAVGDAVGRTTAAALAPGETLTVTRLVPRSPAEGLPPGRVALRVVLADPLAADVVRVGQEVLVFPAAGGAALARGARVLAADPPTLEALPGLGGDGARGVVLALPADDAERVLSGHGGVEGKVVVNVVASSGS